MREINDNNNDLLTFLTLGSLQLPLVSTTRAAMFVHLYTSRGISFPSIWHFDVKTRKSLCSIMLSLEVPPK